MSLLSERLATSINERESENNQSIGNAEFASICNVSRQTAWHQLNGRALTMSGEALLNASEYLGVNARWLCFGIREKQNKALYKSNEANSGQESLFKLDDGLNYNAVDFAVLGIMEFSQEHPKTMIASASRQKAFKYLYRAWFNEEVRKQGAISLLELFV